MLGLGLVLGLGLGFGGGYAIDTPCNRYKTSYHTTPIIEIKNKKLRWVPTENGESMKWQNFRLIDRLFQCHTLICNVIERLFQCHTLICNVDLKEKFIYTYTCIYSYMYVWNLQWLNNIQSPLGIGKLSRSWLSWWDLLINLLPNDF